MSTESQSGEGLQERVDGGGLWLWFVLDADRWIVTTMFLSLVFGGIVVIGVLHPTPAYKLLTRSAPVETLFNALVGSTITGVTLVLTLSQLVLSQELGAVGDQRDRMAGALEFRDDVGDIIDSSVAPAEPAAVLQAIVSTTNSDAGVLQDAAAEGTLPDDARDSIQELVETVQNDADMVTDQFSGAQFGEFEVVRAALNYNYSWKLYAGRRIKSKWSDQLDDESAEALDELLQALELFGPAREHFKTLYFQWELSDLSRTLVYAAIPALTAAIIGLVLLEPRDLPGAIFGVNHGLLLLAILATAAVSPFAVLLAYIIRIVTVTKRTLSIGPFILRETDRKPATDER